MQRKRLQPSFVLALITSMFFIPGCGGTATDAGKSSPPATKTTEPARSGKAADAAKAAGATAESASGSAAEINAAQPTAKPAPPAVPAEPTDTRQLVQVLDLSKLPSPEGATVGEQSPTQVRISVPLLVPAAVDFYLDKLGTLGWQPVGPKTSESVTESFAQVSLGKDGYLLTLTAMPGKPKETTVSIEHVGNLDTRRLPRVDGAEEQYSSQSSSLYFTTAKVDEATAKLCQLLKADGWQEYDRAFSQKVNRPDASDLLFRKKAYSLDVSISKPAARPNKSAVQYFVKTLARDLPAPADAKHVEIEDSRWILMCEVPGDLKATADYYRAVMREIGFSAPPRETPLGKSLTLSFESDDHDLVLVSLAATDEHGTKVKLEGYSAAFREVMKKAEAAAVVGREAREKAEVEAKAERARAFKEASKQQDEMFDAVLGKTLKEAKQREKQSDLSKEIQADVKAKLEKAIQGTGADDSSKPDDQPAKKSEKPKANVANPPEDPAKAVSLPAGKTCQGTMQIRGTTYKLDQAVAYSAIVFDEKYTNVLLSSSAIPVQQTQGRPTGWQRKRRRLQFFRAERQNQLQQRRQGAVHQRLRRQQQHEHIRIWCERRTRHQERSRHRSLYLCARR